MGALPRKSRGSVLASSRVTVAAARKAAAAAGSRTMEASLKNPGVKRRGQPAGTDSNSAAKVLDATRGGSDRRVGNQSNGVPSYRQFAPAGPASPAAAGVSATGRKSNHRGLSNFGGQVNVTPVASQQVRQILSGRPIF